MRTRGIVKAFFALVYLLVLVTQFPHVWQAYRDVERAGEIFQYTSMGAALGFELSLAVFTFRLVTGSTRQWTRRGVAFFIVLSVAANLAYYNVLGGFMHNITPYLFALALPAALALYAEEFGAEVRRDERNAKRGAIINEQPQPEVKPVKLYSCSVPGCAAEPFTSSGAKAVHMRWAHSDTRPSGNGQHPELEKEAAG